IEVPPVLLSGNHSHIEKWRSQKALEKTEKVRPDLTYKVY
ncbi:MAG: tRNA (guanosine(37)-N1)-methyltransferase TrmD, partial [Simkania negevensis]|nr:tRNA (guanosine(37)-N1)-methyltransferase TrmD [Simkania negevensis]